MEADCIVSCKEDISSLIPEQTPGAKHKVGYFAAGGHDSYLNVSAT